MSLNFEQCFERLERKYDGYSFSGNGKDIYNPFCLLCAFDNQDLGSYWMTSGTPTMLIKRLEKNAVEINDIMQDGREVGMRFFADFDSESPDIAPLLYQAGYLTIKEYYPEMESYLVGFPNCEVSEWLCQIISSLQDGNP